MRVQLNKLHDVKCTFTLFFQRELVRLLLELDLKVLGLFDRLHRNENESRVHVRPHTIQEFASGQADKRIYHVRIVNSLLWKNLECILIVQTCFAQLEAERIRYHSHLLALYLDVCLLWRHGEFLLWNFLTLNFFFA